MDVFFYGYGDKFRREWMAAMVGEPSRREPDIDFALGGRDFQGDVGQPDSSATSRSTCSPRAISAARVNLNITRRSHATVPGSSTCRPFELAAPAPRSSPTRTTGIERWFEPGSELLVVEDADAAVGGLPRAARRPCAGGSDGRPGARAGARRAHVPPPRATRLLDLVGLARAGRGQA